MFVYIYVCMRTYIYIYMFVCLYVYLYIHIYIYIYVYVLHANTYINIYIYMYIYVHNVLTESYADPAVSMLSLPVLDNNQNTMRFEMIREASNGEWLSLLRKGTGSSGVRWVGTETPDSSGRLNQGRNKCHNPDFLGLSKQDWFWV